MISWSSDSAKVAKQSSSKMVHLSKIYGKPISVEPTRVMALTFLMSHQKIVDFVLSMMGDLSVGTSRKFVRFSSKRVGTRISTLLVLSVRNDIASSHVIGGTSVNSTVI